MILDWLRRRKRNKILAAPFPPDWEAVIERSLAYYAYLSPDERAKLRREVQVFVAEKNWEGCGGLTVTDEMRVVVAAQACLMTLGLEGEPFRGVLSILIYPAGFTVPEQRVHKDLPLVGESDRLGEAWYRGPVILSWAEIEDDLANPGGGSNLVWHEFAHQLDMLDRSIDGTPPLATRAQRQRWQEVMSVEYERLRRDTRRGRPTLLGPHGADDAAEFFAAASECFFDCPVELRDEHPRLYEILRDGYRQDPAQRIDPR